MRRYTYIALTAGALSLSLLLPGVAALQIGDVQANYTDPYLVEFSFSLRDGSGRGIVTNPSAIQVTCKESNDPISPTETGQQLVNGESKQIKCLLVLDYTQSMASIAANGDSDLDGKSDAIETMEAAAKAFIDGLPTDAQVGIYEFHREDREPRRVVSLTTDKALLKAKIDTIWPFFVQGFPAGTRCWDAIRLALLEYGLANQLDDQRFLIVLSDGRDESSLISVSTVIGEANSRNARVYAIGFGDELDQAPLQQIASGTGGSYYTAATVPDLMALFQEIAHNLKAQYVLRWATLRRSASSFRPSFDLDLPGFGTASYTGGWYSPTTYAGDVLRGELRFVPSAIGQNGSLSMDLRVVYAPRYVYWIRLYMRSFYPFSVSVVPESEGGLIGDWYMRRSDSGAETWIDLWSRDGSPLDFASFGRLIRFRFNGLTDARAAFSQVAVDTGMYADTGQTFVILNKDEVTPPLTPCSFSTYGMSDLAVFYPPTGQWYVAPVRAGARPVDGVAWGFEGAIPVDGDFTGDGRSDLGVYNPFNGRWYILDAFRSSIPVNGLRWGYHACVPVAGDYNGDGIDDVAVYNYRNGNWHILSVAGASMNITGQWGYPGCIPVPGDYDGDGRNDLAVYDVVTGEWHIISLDGRVLAAGLQFGYPQGLPVAGDYNGDGADDLVIYDQITGLWWGLDLTTQSELFSWLQFGFHGTVPVSGDFDGDGVSDLAIYAQKTGKWYIRPASGTSTIVYDRAWGFPGCIPVASAQTFASGQYGSYSGKWVYQGWVQYPSRYGGNLYQESSFNWMVSQAGPICPVFSEYRGDVGMIDLDYLPVLLYENNFIHSLVSATPDMLFGVWAPYRYQYPPGSQTFWVAHKIR